MESQVLAFLQKNKPQAYSAVEIAQKFNRTPRFKESDELGDTIKKAVIGGLAVRSIENALDELVKEGVVEKRTIEEQFGETDYYRAR